MPADVRLPFDREEYAERLARVRAAMHDRTLEVLIVADPSNMAWLTGYDGWSFYTYQCVIVTHDDDPIYWGRVQDTYGARRTVWMGLDNIVAYPDSYVQSIERHPMQHLADTLIERGLDSRRIGAELDNYYYSAAAHRALVESLSGSQPGGRLGATPNDRIMDATGLVNWQRAVKSPRELEYMRIAGSFVAAAHHRIRDVIRPGIRKNDLVAEIYHTLIGGTAEHGGDYPAIVPLLPTGPDASACHLTWNDDVLEVGAGTFFEIAGCYRRYHAPLCRTVYLGTPPDDFRRAEAAVLEGVADGIDAARAGNRACDVAIALNAALARAGIERDLRCGYAIGLSYPPDWGERTISFRTTDTTTLEPGMAFHFMPGLWMDDWGLEITESIVIRESGPAETLSSVPREMFVVDE